MLARGLTLAQSQLEHPSVGRAWRGALARIWEQYANPVRPLPLPPEAAVVGIGGATLGGSGKTPLTLALARALTDAGIRLAIVASAYGARPRRARRVGSSDAVRAVGDEALMLARALDAHRVPVYVAPRRRDAVELASLHARLVLVDGLLQARPQRLAMSLLVLDPRAPWGAGACPPLGNARAPKETLLRAADLVLCGETTQAQLHGTASLPWSRRIVGARTEQGRFVAPHELRQLPLGLSLALARPLRVVEELKHLGIHPREVQLAVDHAIPPRSAAPVAAWLTTAKCATKLETYAHIAPTWVIEERIELPPALIERLRAASRE